MNQSILMSRTEVAAYLGISRKSIIRLEQSNKLTPIKLNDSQQGVVYYKRVEVEALVNP